jgi:hypothetical protein
MLLVILTLIAVIALFVQYGLLPVMDRYNTARKNNDSATARLSSMQNLAERVKEAQERARNAERTIGEEYRDYKVFDAPEDIESAFTQAMLNSGLYPYEINITPVAGLPVNDPFDIYTVKTVSTGTLNGIYAVLEHLNSEFSYRLSDIKVTAGENTYTAAININVVCAREN